ncbi:MAG TPA: glycosyltransferase [Tepidisphaeraceae bacterium]|jgi:glycosyltransferase involved in cell wall biosynthesis
MRVIVAHNFYQQAGGEDGVFAAEVDLLRRFGHEVETFTLRNDAIDQMGKLKALAATVWNRETYRSLRELAARFKPTVVHFHNTFPLISPAAYKAARDEGAAVVQTIHNFRLICPNALLFREGAPCEKCVGKTFALPGVIHKCYRESRQATAAVAGMAAIHRVLGTWNRLVDAYIATSPSAKAKLIQGGMPADKILLKPHFVDPDPGIGQGDGGYATFVGRLSYEKGLETALEAWKILGPDAPLLKIIGDGPLSTLVIQAAAKQSNIQWLGRKTLDEVYNLIGGAAFHVFPSRCYETFGRVVTEAFAKGTPVIASNHGSMADLIDHGRTGLVFTPGNAADLAEKVRTMIATPTTAMRAAARTEFESNFTGQRNYDQMMEIYAAALRRRRGESPVTGIPSVAVSNVHAEV